MKTFRRLRISYYAGREFQCHQDIGHNARKRVVLQSSDERPEYLKKLDGYATATAASSYELNDVGAVDVDVDGLVLHRNDSCNRSDLNCRQVRKIAQKAGVEGVIRKYCVRESDELDGNQISKDVGVDVRNVNVGDVEDARLRKPVKSERRSGGISMQYRMLTSVHSSNSFFL